MGQAYIYNNNVRAKEEAAEIGQNEYLEFSVLKRGLTEGDTTPTKGG